MRPKRDLSGLFNPRSVCIVGASADPSRLTGRPLGILTRHGFGGHVTVVNPKYREIASVPCYPSVHDLPDAPDVAVICLPAPVVASTVAACGQRGIRNAVVFGSGFEEVPEGKPLARELKEAAEQFGVNVVGPNCEGLWSTPGRLILTFGSAALRETITTGPVTVLSQSGSIGGGIMRSLQERGIGCRYFVSAGNETDLTLMDYLEYVAEDGHSGVVLLFIEGLKDGWRLRSLAALMRAKGIQVVALKAGSSSSGRIATASHTGKIASSHEVYAAIFEQCGIIEVGTISDLIKAAEVLTASPAPPSVTGRSGLGVIAVSGGSRALIADACEARRVPLAVFADSTERALSTIVPSFGYCKNPTDVTGQVLNAPEIFDRAVSLVASDSATEVVMIQYANRGPQQVEENLDLLGRTVAHTGKPVVVSFLGEDAKADVKQALLGRRVLSASDPDEAIKFISWLYRRRDTVLQAGGSAVADLRADRQFAEMSLTTWQAQVAFLEASGIAVPRWRLLRGADELEQPIGLTFPVVAKALPEDAAHKTEHGLVRLNLRTGEALGEAAADLWKKLPRGRPILVQEMISDGVEMLLTVRSDPDFGPVLAIGAGGVLVELLRDVAYISLPAADGDFARAIDSLQLRHLLGGFRGQAPRDIDAVRRAAEGLSRSYLACYPRVSEIELNPLFVRERGRGVMAVDILVTEAATGR